MGSFFYRNYNLFSDYFTRSMGKVNRDNPSRRHAGQQFPNARGPRAFLDIRQSSSAIAFIVEINRINHFSSAALSVDRTWPSMAERREPPCPSYAVRRLRLPEIPLVFLGPPKPRLRFGSFGDFFRSCHSFFQFMRSHFLFTSPPHSNRVHQSQ